MPRHTYSYNQYVIGACGHACQVWPQVSGVGGADPEVICETCTRDTYGIPDDEELYVWVRIKRETEEKPKRKPRQSVAKKKKNIWDDLMPTEEIPLDGT